MLVQPVCTTEIGRLALKYDDLKAKGVKLATLSADPVRQRRATQPAPAVTPLHYVQSAAQPTDDQTHCDLDSGVKPHEVVG